MREGFDGVFFGAGREGVGKLVPAAAAGLVSGSCEGASVVAAAFGGAGGFI